MTKHRTPSNILDARGAFKKNPGRRRQDPNTVALKPPPKHFDDARRAIWREIVKAAPEGVVRNSDRLMLEIVSELLLQFRSNPVDFPGTKLLRLDMILGKFGLSPADRSRVGVVSSRKQAPNPFEGF